MAKLVLEKECEFVAHFPAHNVKTKQFSACSVKWEFRYVTSNPKQGLIVLEPVKLESKIVVQIQISYQGLKPAEEAILEREMQTFHFSPFNKYYMYEFDAQEQDTLKITFKFYRYQDSISLAETKLITSKEDEDSKPISDDLSDNLSKLLKEEIFADITVFCDSEIFKVHKAILSVRSPVFAAMLQSSMQEAETSEVRIKNKSPEVLRAVFSYIYTGKYMRSSDSIEKVCNILAAADEYMLPGLKQLCANVLRTEVSVYSALNILGTADLCDAVLKRDILQYVCDNYHLLKGAAEWKKLHSENPSLIVDILTLKVEQQQLEIDGLQIVGVN